MTRRRSPRRAALTPLPDCPTVLLGPMCVALRGRIGNRVYKTYGKKIIITRMPSFEGYVPTLAQRQRREQMRAATAFAKAVYADPAARAVYAAAAKKLRRQAFRLAISDFLHGRTRITPSFARPATTPERPDAPAPGRHGAPIASAVAPDTLRAPDTLTHGGRPSTLSRRDRGHRGQPSISSIPTQRLNMSLVRPPKGMRRRPRTPFKGDPWGAMELRV